MAQAHTTIDLLRHGSLEKSGLFCAPRETRLSAAGIEAMRRNTRGDQWDRVYTSPYLRCSEFAEGLMIEPETKPDLCEMNFGEWAALSNEQIWHESQALLELLWTNPLAFHTPGGESMVDFVKRVKQCWRHLVDVNKGKHILVITHAGVIRVILSLVLDIPYQKTLAMQVDYAQRSRVIVYGDGVASLEYHGLKRQL